MKVQTIIAGNCVSLGELPQDIAVITFDQADSKVNLLSSAVMAELSDALAQVEKPGRYRALIIRSTKPNVFIAGADIKEIQSARTMPQEVALQGCEDGKKLLARIEALPIRTVAIIDGRCLGGGTELALACNERIASGNDSTVIGLPEVALGVLPGWGGCVRSGKMVGFAAALPLVLNPTKPWSARRAWQAGLVSEVISSERLLSRAVEVALGARVKRYRQPLKQRLLRSITDTKLARMIICKVVSFGIRKAPVDNQLAARSALAVMNAAFDVEPFKALRLESETFAKLCHTDQCGKCVQKFVEFQASKKKA